MLDGKENKYEIFIEELPKEYELANLPSIIDQGASPICVSAVISDMVNWKLNYVQGKKKKLESSFIYDNGDVYDNGMNPKSALDTLIAKTDYGFNRYAMVGSEIAAKNAIIANGPLMIALNVKKENDDFWNGSHTIGGHAVSLVGWDNDGFKLRNSWGNSYGENGYYLFPYEDFHLILEAWILL